MIQRFSALLGSLNEHRKISASLLLTGEIRKTLRPQGSVMVFATCIRRDDAFVFTHELSSFSPRRMSVPLSASSPALLMAALMAAEACWLE